MKSDKAKSSTLILLYLRQISAGLLIYQPIFIPYLLMRGMNMIDVAVLMTTYNVGVLLLDVPTGYFADHFGRKWALAVANSALVIGTALVAFGHTRGIFILAELFYALAIAMDAGTHSAYLFEWLRKQGREKEYYRYDALGTFLFLVIGAVGTLVAGYFAEKDLQFPIILTIGLTAIGIPAACLLPEKQHPDPIDVEKEPITPATGQVPNVKTSQVAVAPQKYEAFMHDAKNIVKIGRDLISTPGLRWSLGVTVVWLWSRQYINLVISAPYFQSIGLKYHVYGMLYSILTLTSGCIALLSRRLIQKPDLRGLTIVGLCLIPTSFAIMGLNKSTWGLAGFFLFAIPYGLTTSITNTLLNRQFTQHGDRATFLSIVDLFWRIAASAFIMVLGVILAKQGANVALLGATIISGAIVLTLIPGALKYAKEAV